MDYKDISITISCSSASGTLLYFKAHTTYDIIPADSTKTFREINMGFAVDQVQTSSVEIVGAKAY